MIVLEAQFETSAPALAAAPHDGLPELCFIGRSNVGKSSAINALTHRRQLARVSRTPGRTRLLNFFRVTVADRPGPGRRTASLRFCDLPGYGFARAPKQERSTWDKTIAEYLEKRQELCAVVMLVDAEVGPQPKDLEMAEFLIARSRTVIVVATKADRLGRTRRGSALDRIASTLGVPRSALFPFSSHEEIGHDELWDALCTAAGVLGRKSERLLEPAPAGEGGE